MLIGLDDLETSQGSRLREATWRITRDDARDGFGIGLITATVEAGIGSAMRFVLTCMVIFRDTDGTAALETVDQGTTKLAVRHDC